ncbi:MAG: hypothetical protein CVU05_05715 [Bacteroidetes bacterium HGW-Bacteroidetes-21]|nr:MAG: hypothetical protein CVU05_05715 [Bacteroidetes bacterium HGW-Bacteroidetes-21]
MDIIISNSKIRTALILYSIKKFRFFPFLSLPQKSPPIGGKKTLGLHILPPALSEIRNTK